MIQEPIQTYLEYYGLAQDPFSGELNIYSPVGKRHEILEQLEHLNQFSHLSLFVLAPEGYGKSTLYNLLVQQLGKNPSIKVASLRCQQPLSAIELLQYIARSWGMELNSDDIETVLRQIRSHNLTTSLQGLHHCIILDDADILPTETLEALQALKSGLPEDQAIGMTLFAREGVADLRDIFRPVDEQYSVHLPALNNKEVFGFLQDYFEQAGLTQGVPFTPEQVEKIYLASEGIPARVLSVTQDFMIQQSRDQVKSRTGMPVMHIAAVGLLLVVISASFFYQSGMNNKSAMDAPAVSLTDQTAVSQKLQQAVAQVEARQQAPIQIASVETQQDESTGVVVEQAVEAPIPTVVETAPEEVPSVIAKLVEPREETTTSEKAATTSSAIAKTEGSWFVTAPGDHFTVQLLGTRIEGSVKDFIAQQPNQDQYAYYQTRHQGNDWYVVVYGNFENVSDAKRAVAQLPEKTRQNSPWVRSFDSIRASIGQ